MKRQTVSKKLNAFAATASAKAKTLTKPRSRKASTADWDVIVHEFAHCLWVNAYLQAVDESTRETNGGTPSENVEVELTRAPWGGGAQLEDYAPDMPESVVLGTEKLLEKAFGKDAVLADAAAFMEESGKSDKTYGWYLCMEQLGHGVGLHDYGYDTKLKDYATHVDSNNMGWLYMDDDRIMFGMETMGDGPSGTADVTTDLERLVVKDDPEHAYEDDVTEASTKTAAMAPFVLYTKLSAVNQRFLGFEDDIKSMPDETGTFPSGASKNAAVQAVKSNYEDARNSMYQMLRSLRALATVSKQASVPSKKPAPAKKTR